MIRYTLLYLFLLVYLNSSYSQSVIPQEDSILTVVTNNASFKGGKKEYIKYLRKNLKYPNEARTLGIECKVYVQFVVNETGELSDIKIIKGINEDFDIEVKRIFENSPPWNPGSMDDGIPVKQRIVIPIILHPG